MATKRLPAPDECIDATASYVAKFRTARGILTFELFASTCPRLVNNFIYLSSRDYYDRTIFHRVVQEFVIQGGDPTKKGTGNPGYFLPDELSPHSHTVGTLSMANCGSNTNGSQFFIPLVDMPWLDRIYCPIGIISAGESVLSEIRQGDAIEKISIFETCGGTLSSALTWAQIVKKWNQAIRNKASSEPGGA
jgi:peptidyl-prolyl cis-trans isomerase B (cyclophilin B)